MTIKYIDGNPKLKVEVHEWNDIDGNYYGWCKLLYWWGWDYIEARRLKSPIELPTPERSIARDGASSN